MNNPDNFIDKHDDLILQTLSSFSELPDSAEAEDQLHSLPLSVEVEAWVYLYQRCGNDTSSQFTETFLQESANLENCELQHLSLHLVTAFFALHWVHWLL